MYTRQSPAIMAPADYGTGINAALTITYAAARRGLRHLISGVAWSYSAAPPLGALLTILDGANIIFALGITAAGPGTVNFIPPKCGASSTVLTITLSAGGAGVNGRLNVLGHWVDVA